MRARRRPSAAPRPTGAHRPGERIVGALGGRLPMTGGGRLLRKAFPEHWSFLLGEIALYSLVLLILTGVWLT
ncbi:ubiquinol-cytochrome c reductase cytochrome b subunit, partial [Streptomyces sp. NPDC101149]